MYIRKTGKKLIVSIILLAMSTIMGTTVHGADNSRPVADFLNIGVGARAAAMGGAYSSVSGGVDAAYSACGRSLRFPLFEGRYRRIRSGIVRRWGLG